MAQNARLALELFREAAALGDAEAQGEMGVRYSMGLQHPSAWDHKGIVGFGEVQMLLVWISNAGTGCENAGQS